ncbi:MAG: hypothetical protein ACXWW0_13480, partial [Bacteroidia bacterium]
KQFLTQYLEVFNFLENSKHKDIFNKLEPNQPKKQLTSLLKIKINCRSAFPLLMQGGAGVVEKWATYYITGNT